MTTCEYTLALGPSEVERYRLMASRARREEAPLWRAAGIRPGARVADIGCGPGVFAVELAAMVAPDGFVDAVERDPQALAATRATAAGAGATNVRVFAADAAATGLAPASYDVVMLRHVLAHNGSGVREIVAHAATLVRPGGHVYLVDSDVTAVRMVPVDPDLDDESARYHDLLRSRGAELSIGPTLAYLLESHGLEVIDFGGRYEMIWRAELDSLGPARAARKAILAAGLATEEDARRWDAAGARYLADTHGKYLVAPIFHAIGRRA